MLDHRFFMLGALSGACSQGIAGELNVFSEATLTFTGVEASDEAVATPI